MRYFICTGFHQIYTSLVVYASGEKKRVSTIKGYSVYSYKFLASMVLRLHSTSLSVPIEFSYLAGYYQLHHHLSYSPWGHILAVAHKSYWYGHCCLHYECNLYETEDVANQSTCCHCYAIYHKGVSLKTCLAKFCRNCIYTSGLSVILIAALLILTSTEWWRMGAFNN